MAARSLPERRTNRSPTLKKPLALFLLACLPLAGCGKLSSAAPKDESISRTETSVIADSKSKSETEKLADAMVTGTEDTVPLKEATCWAKSVVGDLGESAVTESGFEVTLGKSAETGTFDAKQQAALIKGFNACVNFGAMYQRMLKGQQVEVNAKMAACIDKAATDDAKKAFAQMVFAADLSEAITKRLGGLEKCASGK